MSASSTAVMRCRVSGARCTESPSRMRCVFSCPSSTPSSMSTVPRVTSSHSSLRSWYCSDSASPLRTCRILPMYRSVIAHRISYPQGFSTRVSSARYTAGMSGMDRGFAFQPDYLLDRLKPRLDCSRIRCLGVDPHKRLGAAGSEQHPAAILEVELEAVVRAHARDFDARDLLRLVVRQLLGDAFAVSVVRLALQVDVMARVCVGPDALLEVAKDLRQRLAAPHDHVREEHPDEDAVALGDMTPDAEAARLFPTDDGVDLHHLRSDVFEPDLDLIDLGVELLRQLLDHRGHVHRLDDRPAHAEDIEQVQHQQREHLQLIDEPARLVDDADAVGVAVGEDAQVVAASLHHRDRLVDVGRDGLGVQAAEEGVA